MERVILHCDMNNCYASIETILNPKLKGRALAVCGSVENRHGIVLAKSQEAKIKGVKTAETIWQAKKKCPELLIIPPNYDEYMKYSKKAKKIYYEYTNQVESFGLDECWLDVTFSTHLFGSGEEIANELRNRMKKELGITISVGVSYNKIFAKLGSDYKKPDATTIITKSNYKKLVWPLKTNEMMGIGKATRDKLLNYGIRTIGDLANTDSKFLERLLGLNGNNLWNYANGSDFSLVSDADYKLQVKSVGNGTTCRKDLVNNKEVRNVIHILCMDVSRRLRDNNLLASGIQISVRDSSLFTLQFQKALPYETADSRTLVEESINLFKDRYDWRKTIRSVTIRAINLSDESIPLQINFLNDYKRIKKQEKIDKTVYSIRKKYGKRSLTFANLLIDTKIPKNRTDICTLPGSMLI